ncbi:hypothetical protein LJC07_06065 [Christensenellaceae bacterium OttesenSCG-928-L17]|nr:hypothetical protein [Christensenellaceae bacterium OttesenSCG-928-L17]
MDDPFNADDRLAEIATSMYSDYETYNAQRFTGNEKIQMIIDEIRRKRSELVSGSTIEIRSLDFHYNFSVDEQEQVLRLLQNTHHCIEYGVAQEGEDIEEVEAWKVEEPWRQEGEGLPHISLDGRKRKEKAASAKRFSVKVLDNFSDTTKELGTAPEAIYELRRDTVGNKIFLNDLLLAQYSTGYSTDKMLEAAFNSGGKVVEETTFDGQRINRILNDLKLRKPLWSLFFSVSDKGFRFRQKITRTDLSLMTESDTKLIEEEYRNLRDILLKEEIR